MPQNPPASGKPRPRLYPRRSEPLQPGPIPGVAARLKILIVTDAWTPQVNGVVRTVQITAGDLRALGHDVKMITPEGRFTLPMPTYPEIRLAVLPRRRLRAMIAERGAANLGIYCDVVQPGVIAVGDAVRVLGRSAA